MIKRVMKEVAALTFDKDGNVCQNGIKPVKLPHIAIKALMDGANKIDPLYLLSESDRRMEELKRVADGTSPRLGNLDFF